MLSKCVQCGFYIRKNDEFCLNCGESNSNENLYWWKKNKNIISFFTFLVVLLILVIVGVNLNLKKDFLAFAGILFSLFLGVGVIIHTIYKASKEKEKENLQKNKTLVFKEKVIDNRLSELFERKNNIESVLDKIGSNPSKALQSMQEKLFTAKEIVEIHFARYELQKHKIEFVRHQNKISFYLEEVSFLDSFQTDKAIASSEQMVGQINLIIESLLLDISNKIKPEKKIFLQQLQEFSESCEKLREVLLSKQAMRALQSVEPIKDIEILPNLQAASHSIETFNIQTTLTDFSQDFEELEAEYKRLLADNEVSQKFLNYEN